MLRWIYWTPVLRRVLWNDCCLSVHPSLRYFSQERLFSFFWIVALWQILWIFKSWQCPFFRKNNFYPNLSKEGPKWIQNRFFLIFWKILSSVFLWNNLQWKIILLLMFHHQSHSWQNSGSPIVGQNAVSQSNCKIL